MAEPKREPCDYCGNLIIWTATREGRMPVDAAPDAGGNIAIHPVGSGVPVAEVVGTATRRSAMRRAGVELRLHHKLSCHRAAEWSGPRKVYSAKAGRDRRV